MPWLSRRNSFEEAMMMKGMNPSSPSPLPPNSSVTFIPAMMDGSCGTSPTLQKMTSMQVMMMEMRVMTQNIRCLPQMIGSTLTTDNVMSLWGSSTNVRDLFLQVILCSMEVQLMVIAIPCFLMMPGLVFLGLSCLYVCAITALCWPMRGEQILRYVAYGKAMDNQDSYMDEKWVFCNGAMTSHSQMRSQMMQMSEIFQRPMTGIHNRTMGLVFDTLCMLLSSAMPMVNRSTSTAMYSHLRECLLNSSVRKVILLSHGTGCQIVSMAIDRLHAELPIDVMQKMEIYTFGCAASHLSNPCLTLNSTMDPNPAFTRADGSLVSPVKAMFATKGHRMEDTERVIPHIEHYAMSCDFFARCGVMHHTRSMLGNTMCGREFIVNCTHMPVMSSLMPDSALCSTGNCGFMMSQYLDMLFPTSRTRSCILNAKVAVDMQTAEKREFTAQGVSMQLKAMGLGRRTSSGSIVYPPMTEMSKAEKRASIGSHTMMGSESVEAARKSAKDCQGKTVKQLSRLWMYAGGLKPVGEGVSIVNGVGLGLNGMMA